MEDNKSVEFGNKVSAIPGTLAGAAIAIGVPAITLIYGNRWATGLQLTVVIISVVVGGMISLTATFFGLVIPSSVNHGGHCCKDKEPRENASDEKIV